MAYVKKTPKINESVVDYTIDQENRVGEETANLQAQFNGIVNAISLQSPVTGSLSLVRHGNIMFLTGEYTNTASGQRVGNINVTYAPKYSLQVNLIDGNIQINNGIITHWGQAGTRAISLSWTIADK